MNKTTSQYDHVAKINLENAIILKHLDSSSQEILRRMLQYTIEGNSAEDMARIDENIKKSIADYEVYRLKYEAVPFVEGEAALYEAVSSNWLKMQPFFKEMPFLKA